MANIILKKNWKTYPGNGVQFDYGHPYADRMVACWYAMSPFKDLFNLKSYVPAGTYTGVPKITNRGPVHTTGTGAGALIGTPLTTLTQKTVLVFAAINGNVAGIVGAGNGAWVSSWSVGQEDWNIDRTKIKVFIATTGYWGPNISYTPGIFICAGLVYDGATARVIWDRTYNDTACSSALTSGHVLQLGASLYGSGSSNSDVHLVMIWDRCLDWSQILSIQADPYQMFRTVSPK